MRDDVLPCSILGVRERPTAYVSRLAPVTSISASTLGGGLLKLSLKVTAGGVSAAIASSAAGWLLDILREPQKSLIARVVR